MENIEDKLNRLIRVEKDLEYVKEDLKTTKEDIKETKKEIKNINLVNQDFTIKIERLTTALDANVKSTVRLTEYMEAQQNKPNKTVDTIKNVILTGLISSGLVAGIIYLIKKLIQL